MRKWTIHIIGMLMCTWLLSSCATTKHVPEGSYLLDEVRIVTDNKEVRPSTLTHYLRQNANAKWFSLLKTQLYIYSLSGRDSSLWINKFLRRLGDAPVIYSQQETQRTDEELTKAVQNMGYMGAVVETKEERKYKKIKLTYQITTGRPYKVRSLRYDIADTLIAHYLKADSIHSLLHQGMTFDVNRLDAERARISTLLQRKGYYRFNKDYISFTADTMRHTYAVDLSLHLAHISRKPMERLSLIRSILLVT